MTLYDARGAGPAAADPAAAAGPARRHPAARRRRVPGAAGLADRRRGRRRRRGQPARARCWCAPTAPRSTRRAGSASGPATPKRETLAFGAVRPGGHDRASAWPAAYVLAGRALRPLHRVTTTARRLSGETLDQRISYTGPEDEVAELADTFDAMLDRIAAAFDTQKRFVANASHELRTPLAVMRTEVEVTLGDAGRRRRRVPADGHGGPRRLDPGERAGRGAAAARAHGGAGRPPAGPQAARRPGRRRAAAALSAVGPEIRRHQHRGAARTWRRRRWSATRACWSGWPAT